MSLTTGRQGHDKALLNGLQPNEQTLSSQDFNLGLLNSGQVLLPTEPQELWHWSRGYIVPMETVPFSGWIYCTMGAEVLEQLTVTQLIKFFVHYIVNLPGMSLGYYLT